MDNETAISPIIPRLKQQRAEQADDWATQLRDNVSAFDKWTIELAAATVPLSSRRWTQRMLRQGPWDEYLDPWPLSGAPALPMPVKIASSDSLRPFFRHLGMISGSRTEWTDIIGTTSASGSLNVSKEPHYGVNLCEWEKGVLYEDGRMDLCKMVVGPPNIPDLMRKLESNSFVRHFLLGNNIIGPAGARVISGFVDRHPNRMETWYLAGNCIDTRSFCSLAHSWAKSETITNLWLKRNPLGPGSIPALCDLVRVSPVLRTLDLDQTELSDAGVAQLFTQLLHIATENPDLPLRTLYLNAVGISATACTAIANYLASSHCRLESLYISNNPIGTTGLLTLSAGLAKNTSLTRLCLASCGLSEKGATALLRALAAHRSISTGRGSKDGERLEDSIVNFIERTPGLKGLDLGTTVFSHQTIHKLAAAVMRSKLVYYEARSALPSPTGDNRQRHDTSSMIRLRLLQNVRRTYTGFQDRTYSDFEQSELRWVRSPRDVRFIDSVYRNRDMAAARRQKMVLKKLWTAEDGNLEEMIGS